MNKILILAEKPSVALDIAHALGDFSCNEDYFENKSYVLTSSLGHLLELTAPHDLIKGKWSFDRLPIIPEEFGLVCTNKKASERLKLLIKLIKRDDINTLINACDAGREGELIFRYIVQYSGVDKPIKRLWLQSMTKSAICNAFNQLRDDIQLKPLEDAARSRAEADWLIGINGTRVMTAFNNKEGGFFKTPVGRVQTPTLAIVTERETSIRHFTPRSYWEIKAIFVTKNGAYCGNWIDLDFKKDECDSERRNSRLWSFDDVQDIVSSCYGQQGKLTKESKLSTKRAPALYDLTSLQREANSRFGFSAKTTLALAQALYERHKVLTYPRTDSRHLPEDYLGTVQEILTALTGVDSPILNDLIPCARTILEHNWDKLSDRIFDDKKVSDHFAIIPTPQIPGNLSELEEKIYCLVLRRFLAVFFPAAEYSTTKFLTQVKRHSFYTESKILLSPGWMTVYGKQPDTEGSSYLETSHATGEAIHVKEIQPVNLSTKPPPRYNEATLLSAMEGASELIGDKKLRKAMKERGLGTPATRASIIEGLIHEGYLRREAQELVPTAKARQLITLISGLNVTELISPELTGEWEYKLKQIELGNLDRQSFMYEIVQTANIIVDRIKKHEDNSVPGDYSVLYTPCPKCCGTVRENYRRFVCTDCDFSISKYPAGRSFELPEIEELLSQKKVGPLKNFVSKFGRVFSATLRIGNKFQLEFDFGKNKENHGEFIDFSNCVQVGLCPKCCAHVHELDMNYVCVKSVGLDKTCDFRLARLILQQEITREQMTKLLKIGKTDLLSNFVSSRTHRKFKAFLTCQKDGKIRFEFERKLSKPNQRGVLGKKARVKNGAFFQEDNTGSSESNKEML